MVFSVQKNVLVQTIRSVDSIQVCASVIGKALDAYDFDLEDRFCDANDLKMACTDIKIPEPILQFFAHLYNFKPETYKDAAKAVMTETQAEHDEEKSDDDTEEEEQEEGREGEASDGHSSDGSLSNSRCRKVQSLFQIMYYVYHCGRKKTPMHIMNAESVHALGRCGKIVTQILNHESLSLSYAALRRYQHDLAAFTAHHNKAAVALPCHFDPGQFTSGAIDNWDHEGANVSEHDTVTVLFQDKPTSSLCKPKISETEVTHGPQAFKEVLPCQLLSEYQKPVTRPDISPAYTVSRDIFVRQSQASTTERLCLVTCAP